MGTDCDLVIPVPTSRPRRLLASAVAKVYGMLIFVLWFNPLLMIATHTPDRSQRLLWSVLFVSMLFYFASLVCIPRRYYNIQPFERDGRFYRRFGVRRFRYFVGEGEGIQKLARCIDPQWQSRLTKFSLEEWISWTITAEWVHIGLVFLSLPSIVLAYYRGFTILATAYLFSNIPFNIYPVLLQRYTRAKLLRIQVLQSDCPRALGGLARPTV